MKGGGILLKLKNVYRKRRDVLDVEVGVDLESLEDEGSGAGLAACCSCLYGV